MKILISIAKLLAVHTLAVIVPEEKGIREAFRAADNYYMEETHLESDGKTYIKMKSQPNIYIYSVESWKERCGVERRKRIRYDLQIKRMVVKGGIYMDTFLRVAGAAILCWV
jgi:hypothetical protein